MDTAKNQSSAATKELLVILEKLIAENCYNTSAKNFSGRDELEDGKWIRYPVTVQLKGKSEKFRRTLSVALFNEDDLMRARYVSGTNHFFIMRGLLDVLHYLEEHHGLKLPQDPPPVEKIGLEALRVKARAAVASQTLLPIKEKAVSKQKS